MQKPIASLTWMSRKNLREMNYLDLGIFIDDQKT